MSDRFGAVAKPEELVRRARERSGLSDFGAPGWQPGLERLVAAVASDREHDAATLASIEQILVTRLVNRLRVEGWYAEHGDEASQPVLGPVVIVGQPRTATTALQYLLALDPQFRFPRQWELADPVPPPELAREHRDPRRRAATAREGVRHISTADGPIEDGGAIALHFRHQELGLPVPSYTRWWRDADPDGAFAYYDRVLRLLHSRRPPRRWLVKGPAYLFQLEALAQQYPDARFLMTHRDPVITMPSACSTVLDARSTVLPTLEQDRLELGGFLLEHFSLGAARAIAARGKLGEQRFLDVAQPDLERDAVGTAERIYAFLGLELSDEVRRAMAAWAIENRRGARGEHVYSCEEFGYTERGIREAFRSYLEAFGALIVPGA